MSANKNTRNNDTNVTSQSMDNTVAGIESTYINPRHLTARRQAVKWDAETDRKLLLVGLGREIRPAEFEMIALSFPEKPTPKAIQERLAKLRREQRTVLQALAVMQGQAEQVQQNARGPVPDPELNLRARMDPRNAAARFGVNNIPGGPKAAWEKAVQRQEMHAAKMAAQSQAEAEVEEEYYNDDEIVYTEPAPKAARNPARINMLAPPGQRLVGNTYGIEADDAVSQGSSAANSTTSPDVKSEISADDYASALPGRLTHTRKRALPDMAQIRADLRNHRGPFEYPIEPVPKRFRNQMVANTASPYESDLKSYPQSSFNAINYQAIRYATPTALETMGNSASKFRAHQHGQTDEKEDTAERAAIDDNTVEEAEATVGEDTVNQATTDEGTPYEGMESDE
ncbi:hypothetical protein H2203_000133 [Taxawa tesnikishii (nom. ined.)]|nr:hypothetical protein H2203_000133 [Dothideales sp. JES 119]